MPHPKLPFQMVSLWLSVVALAIGIAQSNDSVQEHPKFVAVNETDRRLDGKYIVVLDQDALHDLDNTVSRVLANATNIQLRRVFRNALPAFAIDVVDDDPTTSTTRNRQYSLLSSLLDMDIVRFVEEEQIISSYADQHFPPSWGLDRIDQSSPDLDQNYHYDPTGYGVTAYIVDTGIRSTHQDFEGRVVCGYNAFADSESCEDGNGHGTHVVGTVGGTRFGVAKQVDLVTVKVLNNEGMGSTSSILEGIDYVAEQGRTVGGAMVANLSLGGFRSTAINLAVGLGNFGGVFFAVAAGNEDRTACLSSPASSSLVTTVAATDRNDARATFSNYGQCVDIFAPGVDILSAWHTGDTDYNTISGTSMASPHVAGVAALYLEIEPNLTTTPQLLGQRIIEASLTGIVGDPADSPNVLLNAEALFTTTSSPPPPGATDPDPLDGSSQISWGVLPSVWATFLLTVLAAMSNMCMNL